MKKQLLETIAERLKQRGATAGEICTELLRLERATIDGLEHYLSNIDPAPLDFNDPWVAFFEPD